MISGIFSRRLFWLGSCSVRNNATTRHRPYVLRFASTAPTSDDTVDDENLAEKIKVFGTYIPVLSENPLQQGTSHILRRTVPPHIAHGLIELGTDDELKVRRAGALAAMALQKAQSLVKPGVTSEEIDNEIHDFIVSHGAYPSPLNYDQQGQYLTRLAGQALDAGISICRPGAYFKDIGKVIQNVVRQAEEITGDPTSFPRILLVMVLVETFIGHRGLSIQPLSTVNEEPGIMKPGHCFTIEPAIIQGKDPDWWILPDGWTILSKAMLEQRRLSTRFSLQKLGLTF
ncbi:Methionine aminopeptidase [Rhizoctonia solani]|uniref:Methionine aminopeptidase n=1 Tax=Rhizoctonia solani TaxID=456999 RepID=A0A8H7IJF9_9AGAM|nr:Methionine aminopeptidase [Rhizoctonia solani]